MYAGIASGSTSSQTMTPRPQKSYAVTSQARPTPSTSVPAPTPSISSSVVTTMSPRLAGSVPNAPLLTSASTASTGAATSTATTMTNADHPVRPRATGRRARIGARVASVAAGPAGWVMEGTATYW